MYSMTAAHKTLPIPSYVKVTKKDNGKSTVVRVNDRGPFHDGRIIDLSNAAAYKIMVVQAGTANVRIEVITVDKPTKPRPKVKQRPRIYDSGGFITTYRTRANFSAKPRSELIGTELRREYK